MKKLIFQELIIASDSERSAEVFRFGPKKNLILGQKNKVGKTSLSTSLLWAFGCKPKFPPQWAKLYIRTLITFEVDGKKYSIMRTQKSIALKSGERTEFFEKIGGDFSKRLSKILDSRAYLKPQSSKYYFPAIPSALFLSSFIHSDTGWGEIYKSFEDLMMYNNSERKYLTEYLIGIRGEDFFKPRKERSKLEDVIEKSEIKIEQYELVLSNVRNVTSRDDITVNDSHIDFLLEDRSFYVSNLMEAKKEKYDISKQIQLINKAEHDLFLDYQFATNNIDERLVTCPTCGVIHENDIVNRFSLLDEREKLKESRAELEDDLSSLNIQIKKVKTKVDQLSARIAIEEKVANLPPSLDEFVAKSGTIKMFEPVFSELIGVENKLIDDSNKELEMFPKFRSTKVFKEQTKKIKEEFASALIDTLHEINVFDANESDILDRPYDKIHVSGSDISRMTLAYYKTLNDFKRKYCDCVQLPIVIDSPMQQEQDDDNIETVSSFIGQWNEQQLLLFGRDYPEYESLKLEKGTKVINLERDRRILSQDRYNQLINRFQNL